MVGTYDYNYRYTYHSEGWELLGSPPGRMIDKGSAPGEWVVNRGGGYKIMMLSIYHLIASFNRKLKFYKITVGISGHPKLI